MTTAMDVYSHVGPTMQRGAFNCFAAAVNRAE
jgi:hypothetical protein